MLVLEPRVNRIVPRVRRLRGARTHAACISGHRASLPTGVSLSGRVVCLLRSCDSSLHILDKNLCWVANMFFQYVLSWLAFSFSTVSLEEQYFSFGNSAFCILSKKSLSYNPKVAKIIILMFFFPLLGTL